MDGRAGAERSVMTATGVGLKREEAAEAAPSRNSEQENG